MAFFFTEEKNRQKKTDFVLISFSCCSFAFPICLKLLITCFYLFYLRNAMATFIHSHNSIFFSCFCNSDIVLKTS